MTTTPEIAPEVLESVAPESEPSIRAGAAAPVLISEQEVALGTAAAVGVRPSRLGRWTAAWSVVVAAARKMSLALTPDERAPQRHYPKRYVFLEQACMAREMDRL